MTIFEYKLINMKQKLLKRSLQQLAFNSFILIVIGTIAYLVTNTFA